MFKPVMHLAMERNTNKNYLESNAGVHCAMKHSLQACGMQYLVGRGFPISYLLIGIMTGALQSYFSYVMEKSNHCWVGGKSRYLSHPLSFDQERDGSLQCAAFRCFFDSHWPSPKPLALIVHLVYGAIGSIILLAIISGAGFAGTRTRAGGGALVDHGGDLQPDYVSTTFFGARIAVWMVQTRTRSTRHAPAW